MPLPEGTRLGPYEIVGLVGAGGMGEVYRARDPRLGRNVAIKILPAAFSTDSDRLWRFEREARAVASLNHPHICIIHDIGDHDGHRYLVMELLEGLTLSSTLETGPLSTPLLLIWPFKSPMHSTPLMARASFIAISSRPTFSSPNGAKRSCWILVWPS